MAVLYKDKITPKCIADKGVIKQMKVKVKSHQNAQQCKGAIKLECLIKVRSHQNAKGNRMLGTGNVILECVVGKRGI